MPLMERNMEARGRGDSSSTTRNKFIHPMPKPTDSQAEHLCKEAALKLNTICTNSTGKAPFSVGATEIKGTSFSLETDGERGELPLQTSTPDATVENIYENVQSNFHNTLEEEVIYENMAPLYQIPLRDRELKDLKTSIMYPPPPPPSPGNSQLNSSSAAALDVTPAPSPSPATVLGVKGVCIQPHTKQYENVVMRYQAVSNASHSRKPPLPPPLDGNCGQDGADEENPLARDNVAASVTNQYKTSTADKNYIPPTSTTSTGTPTNMDPLTKTAPSSGTANALPPCGTTDASAPPSGTDLFTNAVPPTCTDPLTNAAPPTGMDLITNAAPPTCTDPDPLTNAAPPTDCNMTQQPNNLPPPYSVTQPACAGSYYPPCQQQQTAPAPQPIIVTQNTNATTQQNAGMMGGYGWLPWSYWTNWRDTRDNTAGYLPFSIALIVLSICNPTLLVCSIPACIGSLLALGIEDVHYDSSAPKNFSLFCNIFGVTCCILQCLSFTLFIVILVIVAAAISQNGIENFLREFFGISTYDSYIPKELQF